MTISCLSGLVMTTIGVPMAELKCFFKTACPSTASDSARIRSVCDTPFAFSCNIPTLHISRNTTVAIHVVRGLFEIIRPTRCHSRLISWLFFIVAALVSSWYFGRAGQNELRPNVISSAGRNESVARSEKTMPVAAIGPRLRLELRSENKRHSSATMTVSPEAIIGSKAALKARAIANHFDSM
ncbi:hypothetical protein D3C73_1069740 [compost metagenome]